MSDEFGENWRKTDDLLWEDLLTVVGDLDNEPDSQLRRRIYVRTAYSTIEGNVYGLKKVTLVVALKNGAKLSEDEFDKLMEKKFERDLSFLKIGQPAKKPKPLKWKNKFLPFGDNVKFALKTFTKVHGTTTAIDFQHPDWQALLDGAEVRNRITHPKDVNEMEVTQDELELVRLGARWYFYWRAQIMKDFISSRVGPI